MLGKWNIVVVLGALAAAVSVYATEHTVLEEPVLRASRMIGLDVVDRQIEKVGQIDDLVVGQDGERITHVIVAARGAEGDAVRRHPVPIEAVRIVQQGADRPKQRGEQAAKHGCAVRLNVTRDRFQEAPALKADDLSVLADTEWLNRLAKFHKVLETTKRREQPVLTAKHLLDMEVRGPKAEAEHLASLNDMVFDAPSGRIRYGALTFKRIEDVAEKLFPVPWALMTITINEAQYLRMRRKVTAEMVRAAEGFANDAAWPATADERWLTGDFRKPREDRVGEREQPLLR